MELNFAIQINEGLDRGGIR